MCNAAAISSAEAGALLTCRKRNMLSGLSCERRGIGGQFSGLPHNSTYFFSLHVKLFSVHRGFIRRPTHDRLAALRQASRYFPETGKPKGGGETRPASLFFCVNSVLRGLVLNPFSLLPTPPLYSKTDNGSPLPLKKPTRTQTHITVTPAQ